ncbi:MAG: hypothetical protein AB8B59_02085 [Maribacter sp.]
MDHTIIAFLIFIVAIFISRVINQKANKKLDANKKAELVDLFSKKGLYTFGILIIIIAFYLGNLKFQWINPSIANSTYFIILILFILISRYIDFKKLRDYDFPNNYIKMYLLSSTIRFVGLVIALFLMGLTSILDY